MDTLERLLRAAHWGMSLALVSGCGGSSSSDGSGGDGGVAGTGGTDAGTGGSTTGGSGGTGGTTSGGTGGISGSGGAQHLEPYPKEKLGCSGPEFDGGYYGQCCVEVGCFDPAGGAECPSAETATGIPGYPPGSGTCTCGEPTAGPYAPHEASEGACCYLFGSISCDGRPLIVTSGETRVAPIVRRSDWV
jgi:hypothetical protein